MSEESTKESVSKQGALGPNERWSARRKRDVTWRLLRGDPLFSTTNLTILMAFSYHSQASEVMNSCPVWRRNISRPGHPRIAAFDREASP